MRKTHRFLIIFLFIAIDFQLAAGQSPDQSTDQSDDTKAEPELTLEQKAEKGDAEAQNEMGLDADRDHHYAEAFKWFDLAAKQGLSKSQLSVGYAYDQGLGVEKDPVQAVHWYALAAAQGYAQAEFNLGMCYHLHDGVGSDEEKNHAAAIKWFSLALSHGNSAAANGLGLVYEHGPNPDFKEAFRWYKKGAELGDEEAAYNACRFMAQGIGAPQDYSEAFRLCTQASGGSSKITSSWGEYGLGRIYDDGSGVPQDYAKAAEWYRKSASQGNPASQLRLGQLYSEGKGVKRDPVEAYMWMAVAGSLRHPEALDELQVLTPKMKEADLVKGQSRAREWIERNRRDPEDDPSGNVLYPR